MQSIDLYSISPFKWKQTFKNNHLGNLGVVLSKLLPAFCWVKYFWVFMLTFRGVLVHQTVLVWKESTLQLTISNYHWCCWDGSKTKHLLLSQRTMVEFSEQSSGNYRPRVSDTLFWTPWATGVHICLSHIHKINI